MLPPGRHSKNKPLSVNPLSKQWLLCFAWAPSRAIAPNYNTTRTTNRMHKQTPKTLVKNYATALSPKTQATRCKSDVSTNQPITQIHPHAFPGYVTAGGCGAASSRSLIRCPIPVARDVVSTRNKLYDVQNGSSIVYITPCGPDGIGHVGRFI